MTLFNRSRWLAYWEEESGFLFLDPSMTVGARVLQDGLFDFEGFRYVVFGPYWRLSPGRLRAELWMTSDPDDGYVFDCVGRTSDNQPLKLGAAEVQGVVSQQLILDIEEPVQSVEFRLMSQGHGRHLLCLNGLKVTHHSVQSD